MRLRQEELRDDCNLCYTASLSRCHDVTGTRAKLHKYETTWTEVICIISLHIRIQRVACTPALDYVKSNIGVAKYGTGNR